MKLVVISILYVKFKVGNTTAWLEVLCVNATEKKKDYSCGAITSTI